MLQPLFIDHTSSNWEADIHTTELRPRVFYSGNFNTFTTLVNIH